MDDIDSERASPESKGYESPLIYELAKQMLDAPGHDTRISCFAQAFLELHSGRNIPAEHIRQARDATEEVLMALTENEIQPTYGVNKLLRCVQKQMMYRGFGSDYPDRYNEVQPWREGLLNMLLDHEALGEMLYDIRHRETQSNVVQRYVTLKIIAGLLAERISQDIDVLDIGCSQNLGLKKVASQGRFEEVTALEYSQKSDKYIRSTQLTKNLGTVMMRAPEVAVGLGVDKYDMRNTSNIEWVKACSSYPSELLDRTRYNEAQELGSTQVEGVTFLQADITKRVDHLNQFTRDGLFDFVVASTCMYQMTLREREKTIAVAYESLRPNGVMIIQDFVAKKGSVLTFSGPGADKFAYRAMVMDKLTDFDRTDEIVCWETARCRRVVLGDGELYSGGRLRSVQESIMSTETR